MPFITRAEQTENRQWDPFCPLKRIIPKQTGLHSLVTANLLRDELLDGISIPRRDIAAHWINENVVHRAIALSHRIADTRPFLGTQVIATRDDIRQISHFLIAESDSLYSISTDLGNIVDKRLIYSGTVRRAHITLDNYSGKTSALYVGTNDGKAYSLGFNGVEIETASSNTDFPFMAWSQAAKGHIPMGPPEFGLLTYKCRDSGTLFLRPVSSEGTVGAEIKVAAPQCLGGLDFAINNDDVLFHVDAIVDGKLVPMTASSSDKGKTISEFAAVDLAGFVPDAIVPAACPIARDHIGNFHVPVAALKDGKQHLLDIHSGFTVEAMVLKGKTFGYSLLVFPKAGNTAYALGRGDGVTDGIGIIATTVSNGQLLISNSQAGGFNYPQERCVNHEMAQMFAFRATECCYTRAQTANMVSMDYVFLEANHDGDPLSNTLWLETWDMPLPIPVLSAVADDRVVRVKIEKDAWFENGKTTFTFSDPKIKIESIEFLSTREAQITCNTNEVRGTILSFDMKNFLYWHAGSTSVL